MLNSCVQAAGDIVLIADPRVTAIPIQARSEALIDIRGQTTIAIGPSPEIPNNQDYYKMRQTVYNKLLEAASYLPSGLQFCLYESYRSINLQEKLFNTRYQTLQHTHPDWSHQQLFIETIKLISPVINLDGSKNIPPHSTGAAIDVYLLNSQGQAIDMGIHPKDWLQDIQGLLSQTDSNHISKQAKINRQIMSTALQRAGFINYPTEYWHWSYGDKYWAYQTNHPYALYESCE